MDEGDQTKKYKRAAVGALVLVVLAIGGAEYLSRSASVPVPETAPATATTAVIPNDASDASIALDLGSIDAGLQGLSADMGSGSLTAASAEVASLCAMTAALQTKLQERIVGAQAAGADVGALEARYVDVTAAVSDAAMQGAKGDAVHLTTSMEDLSLARQDMGVIVSGLKSAE